jgi:hypothetical protein
MEQQPNTNKIEKWEITDETTEACQKMRENLLNNFENKIDGLDIERVAEFMWLNNLPIIDFIAYDEEDIPVLNELLKGLISVKMEDEGMYVSPIDLIFIKRQRVRCHLNGSVYDEATLVHEFGHGASEHAHFARKIPTKRIKQTRDGFRIYNILNKKGDDVPWGNFLEEGFAELLSGEYREENTSSEISQKIKNRQDNWIRENDGWQYDTPLKYLSYYSIDEKGVMGISYAIPSIAAVGLEMLFKKNPELRQTLIQARSNVEKLREIPKLINAIKPGLYAEIQKCGYSEEEFSRVQNIIKEAIENSK